MFLLFGGSEEPNLLDASENLTYTGQYTVTSITLTADDTAAPDGTVSAELCEPSGANSFIQVSNETVNINTDYTFSVWLKSTGADREISISIRTTGLVLIGANELITVTSNWKRFFVTRNVVGNSVIRCLIGGTSTWATGENLYAWGCQLNKGILSSYQRTETPASSLDIDVSDSLANWLDAESHELAISLLISSGDSLNNWLDAESSILSIRFLFGDNLDNLTDSEAHALGDAADNYLLESGDNLLMESGDLYLLE